MSTANLALQIEFTAGAIPVVNEKGAVSVNKVKFFGFPSKRRSKYTSDKNNEEGSVGEFPYEKIQAVTASETEINEETAKDLLKRKVRELLQRGQDDDDDDKKDRCEPQRHSHEPAAAEELVKVKEIEQLFRRMGDDEAPRNDLVNFLQCKLSDKGGITSIKDVQEFISLMKKFSKKFGVYYLFCDILQATNSDILSEYLDKGGWEIINTLLQDEKSSSSDSFLIEMLKLCKLLPITISRLKENNTGKLIKKLMKHENDEIKRLSSEVVNLWTSVIREKSSEITGDKKKKRDKSVKIKKDKAAKSEPVKDETKSSDKSVTDLKEQVKRKGVKRFVEGENKKPEMYEDVKSDPELLIPVSKKTHIDRPKTAKICQKKFRATGLKKETPLLKNISKKIATVDKRSVVAVKNALKLNTSSLDTVTEKKIKLESLIMTIHGNASSKGNTKLSPPKRRSTYVLQESENILEKLMCELDVLHKSKKNIPLETPVTTASPTSPTRTVLNLQFYKDTLEMNEENKENEKPDTPSSPNNESNYENTDPAKEENIPMDITEEDGYPPMNDESNGPTDDSKSKDENSSIHGDPNLLCSILSHGKRKGKKKNVRWVNDENIEQIFYFEMDDTERVNVARNLQSTKWEDYEMEREIEAIEMTRRHAGNQIGRWWTIPVLIDLPPPLAIPGCNSEAKNIEIMRQQSTFKELYVTREMIPESPHEPDLEIVAPKEPKVIPLDEDNLISPVSDYSNFKPVQLPKILASLLKLNPTQTTTQLPPKVEAMQISTDPQPNKSPLINSEPLLPQKVPLLGNQPYEPGPKPILGNKKSLLGDPPVQFLSPENDSMELQGEWRTPQGLPSNEQGFGRFPPVKKNRPLLPQPPGIGIRAPTHHIRPNFRGGPSSNIRPPRNRVICRHFVANHCRYGMNCTFRHPGVNCPL